MKNSIPELRSNGAWRWPTCWAIASLTACFCALPAAAQSAEPDAVSELRNEIAELKESYQRRIDDLEDRLHLLESRMESRTGTEAASPKEDDLAKLRRAAQQAIGEGTASAAASSETVVISDQPVAGQERNLNRLNPEISFTGIVVASGGDRRREEFRTQEFELDLQSALDPFSRTRWTLAFGEEGIEVEEGYINYNSLPGNLDLLAGRFRQRFGPLNRQHLHALPQTGYPLVYQTYFGEEGLAQTGVSLTWLLPKPWASSNEISLEITDGDNEVASGGEDFQDLAVLARLQNYWDLSESTYIEWGLSGISGKTADGGDNRIWGTDVTYQWRPPERAKYREVTWRTEIMLSQRDDPTGARQEAWGGYTYIEGLVARNVYGGVRVDRVERIDLIATPFGVTSHLWGISPFISFWQSEFVRLRAEYGYLNDDFTNKSSNSFTLQVTWAAGPHKHETY